MRGGGGGGRNVEGRDVVGVVDEVRVRGLEFEGELSSKVSVEL